ncbi:NDP-hexose 2,3-dehydratase family protein [Nocardiopsis mwathae]|uniref:NDP-hexose 2,3-dehydratase family protein n=1 Tax=Nocardiopsis mwathae TaxID=1472723 RepID=UPI003742B8B1
MRTWDIRHVRHFWIRCWKPTRTAFSTQPSTRKKAGGFCMPRAATSSSRPTRGAPPLAPPPGYAWVTPAQLTSLVRHTSYVNVKARTLLACLNTIPAST